MLLCCLGGGTNLLAQAVDLPVQARQYQALALADPIPVHLYNAGVAWEQANNPVRVLYFYRQARALGLPEAAIALARVEVSLQLPSREALVLPAWALWAAALGCISLASLLGTIHLLRPRRPLQRLAGGFAGLGLLAGGGLLLQGWLLTPGPLVTETQDLRQGPGLAFPVVSQVPAGVEVRLQESRSGWVRLSYEQQQGWLPQGALLQ